jgi:glucokinase
MSSDSILLADAGGTFTRFALTGADGVIAQSEVMESGAFSTFEEAARDFLSAHKATPARAAIAAAGPVESGAIQLTNGPQWRIAEVALREALGLERVLLVNDFAAVAAAAPRLPADKLLAINAGGGDGGAIAVVGPGTGLGVALVTRVGQGFRVLPGEGGHAGLSPVTDREIAVLYQLIRRFGHVKAEHVLSGLGLEILWETLAALDGKDPSQRPTAGEIAERARRKSCDLSIEAIEIMTGWLGGFAGDVCLIAGATGGLYLAGGVLPRWGELFDARLFLRRFTAKGAHRALLERTPVHLITDTQTAFKGLLALLNEVP